MSSWSAIAEANVLTQISGTEIEALRAAALADGQADPVTASIAHVTDHVRGYVAACRNNKLHTTTTYIPDRLMSAACALVIAEVITRVPGYELDAKRQAARDNATSLLREVAACRFAIPDPDTDLDYAGNIEVATYNDRTATRTTLDGL